MVGSSGRQRPADSGNGGQLLDQPNTHGAFPHLNRSLGCLNIPTKSEGKKCKLKINKFSPFPGDSMSLTSKSLPRPGHII